MIKHCEKCDKKNEGGNMVRKRKIVTVQGNSSVGCSMRTYYYCPTCVPKDESELPEHTPSIVVGQIVSN